MDTAAQVLMANAAARKVFGEALVGRSWLELCPQISSEAWAGALASPDVVFLEARSREKALRVRPPVRPADPADVRVRS